MADYLLYPTTAAGGVIAANEPLLKENIEDEIINLFPDELVLQLFLPNKPSMQTWGEQPVDTINNVTRTNAVLALGDDEVVKEEYSTATLQAATFGHKIRYVTEIHQTAFGVSGTSIQASTYGFANRQDYEAMKIAKQQMLDFELRCWFAPGSNPAGQEIPPATGTPAAWSNPNTPLNRRQTQGLFHWITNGGIERGNGLTASKWNYHGEVLKSGTQDYRTWAYNANGLPLTADMWTNKLLTPWSQIAKGVTQNTVAFMSNKARMLFRTFALPAAGAVNTRTIAAGERKIVDAVDIYETDAGKVAIKGSYYLNVAGQTATVNLTGPTQLSCAWDEMVLVINPEGYCIRTYRPQQAHMLGRTKDGEEMMYVMEKGLQCRSPFYGAGIVNCVAAA